MPISALESTGASLIPSPTKASTSFFSFSSRSFSTSKTLSAGSNSLLTTSTPICFPTASATFFESPVSITTFFTPAFFKSLTAFADVGLIISDMIIQPAYTPSTDTYTSVPVFLSIKACVGVVSMPYCSISFLFPARIFLPFISAHTPCPLISSISDITLVSISLLYAFLILLLIGCVE